MKAFLPTLVSVLTAVFLVATGCQSRHTGKPRLGEVERLPHLEVITPEKHASLAVRKTYVATVDAFEKADLCAQIRGLLKTMPVDIEIGRQVKENEALITLAIPDVIAEQDNKKALLEQSKTQLEQSLQARRVTVEEVNESLAQEKRFHAELAFRDAQHVRVTRLAQGETVSKQMLEEATLQQGAAQAALSAARAQVQTRRARLLAADVDIKVAETRVKVAQTEAERLEATVGFATIRAPFDGVITKRWVDRGATIKDPGMPLLTVMRTGKVRVILDIPERDVPYIIPQNNLGSQARATPVEVVIPALREVLPQLELKGGISVMASALDPSTRTMRAEVHLENKEGHLKPQMTGTATVVLSERSAFTVPSSALVRLGEKMAIYHIADVSGDPPRGVVRRMEVQLGLDDGQRAEILRPTLSGREMIIVKGNGVVQTGEPAIVVPARKADAP